MEIIAFESGTKNFHNQEQHTCLWQAMCYQKPLIFNLSLRKIFSKSSSLRVMKKFDERALMQVLQQLGIL